MEIESLAGKHVTNRLIIKIRKEEVIVIEENKKYSPAFLLKIIYGEAVVLVSVFSRYL